MSDEQWPRVYAWLKRHQVLDLELTPLVEARIAARHRSERIERVGYPLAMVGFLVMGTWQGITDRPAPSTAGTIGLFIAAYLVIHAATGLAFWLQRRAELRLASGLTRRVSRSTAVRLPDVVGRQRIWSVAVVYGGGLLVGATLAAIAETAVDRIVAGVFVLGVVLFGALSLWLLGDVVRRPAVADEERSLRADDRLRTVDADRALIPYPVALAVLAMVGSEESLPLWVFLGYVIAASLSWLAQWLPRVWGGPRSRARS